MILVRLILIGLVIYLLVRYLLESLGNSGNDKPVNEPENSQKIRNKKVSKEIGEYIDYEEIKD